MPSHAKVSASMRGTCNSTKELVVRRDCDNYESMMIHSRMVIVRRQEIRKPQ